MIELKIIIEKGEDGYIVANAPALKGCWSQGKTEAEAIKNIKEAIHLYPKRIKSCGIKNLSLFINRGGNLR
jgi:predicted RNase H-like HicB family nuclease